jgi:hypothetical protein
VVSSSIVLRRGSRVLLYFYKVLSGLVSGLTSRTCHGWLIFDTIAEVISLFSTTRKLLLLLSPSRITPCLTFFQSLIDIITLRIRALWTDNREVNFLVQSVWVLHVLGSSALLVNSILKNQCTCITCVPRLTTPLTLQIKLRTVFFRG